MISESLTVAPASVLTRPVETNSKAEVAPPFPLGSIFSLVPGVTTGMASIEAPPKVVSVPVPALSVE